MPEKRTQYDAMQMARKLRIIHPSVTARMMPGAMQRRDTWADVLMFYGSTGKRSGFCDDDAAAAEAWAWVMREESPLDGYESAYTGPNPTGANNG